MKGTLPAPARTICYVVSGAILNAAEDPVVGYGTAVVLLRADGLAEIHYQVQIAVAGTSTSDFLYGLNRDLVRKADMPVINPTVGGMLLYYTSDGTLDTGVMEYAGTHTAKSQFWTPARVYTTDGDIGSWPTSKMSLGMHLDGVCYGTYEVI